MTGIVVSIGIVSLFVVMFMWLHRIRKLKEKLEHPDWVAHRKNEQERRKLEKERRKEDKRLNKLARKLKKRSQISPEPFLTEAMDDDESSHAHGFTVVRNRVPTVSESVDRFVIILYYFTVTFLHCITYSIYSIFYLCVTYNDNA